ncbi:MAG: chorismate synthase [Vulcanimicrobiota bacterium]
MRILFSGESHMDGLAAIIEGFPAGFEFDEERINKELNRRQTGYGRSHRMEIETDKVTVYSGVIGGRTIGSPITFIIPNKDNRRKDWSIADRQTIPRPGHADLPGLIKYGFEDIRLVAERASARQTAAWTAVGSLLMQFLEKFNIKIFSFVRAIGEIEIQFPTDPFAIKHVVDKSPLRIPDAFKFNEIKELIDKSKEEGETLGGIISVVVRGCPVGLGSYAHPDCRLDSQLAGALMAAPSIKGIEFGDGFKLSSLPGSETTDPIKVSQWGFNRATNHAGGIEGGLSNGMDIVMHLASKPIPTMKSGMTSIDINNLDEVDSPYIRTDICVVPAVSVICEMLTARVVAESFLERFGADTFEGVCERYRNYKDKLEVLLESS